VLKPGADSGEKRRCDKWFGRAIVRAQLKPGEFADEFRAARNRDDAHLPRRVVLAEHLQNLAAAQTRQIEVEQNQVGFGQQDEVDRLHPVGGNTGGIPSFLQRFRDDARHLRVMICNRNFSASVKSL
jgi:hypothetical protein